MVLPLQRLQRKREGTQEEEGDDKGHDEDQKFDEFKGNDVGLIASAEYDENDNEADAVWEAIDERMDSRRKDRELYHASNTKITEQFVWI